MAEAFLVRTVNGPRPGTRVAEGWAWPLPVLLLAEGGQYVKVSESSLEPQAEDSHVLRGAEYCWHPGDPLPGQLTGAIAVEIRAKRFDAVEALLILLTVKDPESAGTIRDTIIALAETRPGE